MTDPLSPHPSTTPPAVVPPARSVRVLRWALFVSLAFNLVVAGVVVGGVVRGIRTPPTVSGVDSTAIWFAMPREARDNLRRSMGPPDGMRHLERADRQAQSTAANARLLALLRAAPFEAEPVADWLRAEHDRRAARTEQIASVLVAEIARLSPQQRAEMADRLEMRLSRRPSR